jgi:hypothetical protein
MKNQEIFLFFFYFIPASPEAHDHLQSLIFRQEYIETKAASLFRCSLLYSLG